MLKDPFIKGLEDCSAVKSGLVSYLCNQVGESGKVILINKFQVLLIQALSNIWKKLEACQRFNEFNRL
jgi:hypothetical protein